MRSNAIRAPISLHATSNVDGTIQFDISDELSCQYHLASQALWTQMNPKGIPCFSPALLHDMERGSQIVESHFSPQNSEQPLAYIVLQSRVPRVFNLGGDFGKFLSFISAQDKAALTEYARTAINVVYRNYTSHNLRGVTTIALLEGDALGGGLECAVSCDVVIAERHVKCGFPEVLFDMFPGMGALSFLSRRCSRRAVQELTRSGRQFSADELFDMGVIDVVAEPGAGKAAVQQLIKRRQSQVHGHNAMNNVDRMLHPVTLQELYDVVGLWVNAAMTLSSRGQEWMRRLYMQQLKAFGPTSGQSSAVIRSISSIAR
jgi:DSF synthase